MDIRGDCSIVNGYLKEKNCWQVNNSSRAKKQLTSLDYALLACPAIRVRRDADG